MTNGEVVDAVHVQPVPPVTVIVDVPPAGATVSVVGDTVNEHDAGVDVVVPELVVVVVVVLGVAGVELLEQPAVARAIASATAGERRMVELTNADYTGFFQPPGGATALASAGPQVPCA